MIETHVKLTPSLEIRPAPGLYQQVADEPSAHGDSIRSKLGVMKVLLIA
ncbi:MAG: hypothetical protein ACHQIK_15925 [Candidatus Acidiferrales bacterium]